jgi:hypothetical protein
MSLTYISVGLILVFVYFRFLNTRHRQPNPSSPGLVNDATILELARKGNKIQAIKYYRQLHGGGLKEAKEAVEKMLK